jgi:4Fe-4S ferredoxin
MTDATQRHIPDSCGPDAGRVAPVVNRNRCEAKADCVRVCPYQVFAIEPVRADDRSALSLVGKLRLAVHGGKQAYAVNADACHGCGVCVDLCPEHAITLAPVTRA